MSAQQALSPAGAVDLSVSALLAAARKMTGIEDMAEDGFGDRLNRLLTHMDRDLGLDAHQRQMAFDSVVELLAQRAKLLDDRKRYPGLAEEVIEAPIVVAGLPRSGTTLMHALMAADPNNRAPRYWEVIRPSPPPGLWTVNDSRISYANQHAADMTRYMPDLLLCHPFFDQGAQMITECESIVTHELHNLYGWYFMHMKAMPMVDLTDDPFGAYRFHRMMLQALQYRRPKRRWVVKGTENFARLSAIKAAYPDAKVIWVHRDPVKSLPSVMKLLTTWAESVVGHPVDRPFYGRMLLNLYKGLLQVALADPVTDHPDVHHLMYEDFVADPIGRIGDFYKRYGIPFDTTTANAMQNYLANPANHPHRHGRFKYSLAEYNMTTEELEAEMGFYRARFNIPHETKERTS